MSLNTFSKPNTSFENKESIRNIENKITLLILSFVIALSGVVPGQVSAKGRNFIATEYNPVNKQTNKYCTPSICSGSANYDMHTLLKILPKNYKAIAIAPNLYEKKETYEIERGGKCNDKFTGVVFDKKNKRYNDREEVVDVLIPVGKKAKSCPIISMKKTGKYTGDLESAKVRWVKKKGKNIPIFKNKT